MRWLPGGTEGRLELSSVHLGAAGVCSDCRQNNAFSQETLILHKFAREIAVFELSEWDMRNFTLTYMQRLAYIRSYE